MSFYAVSFVRAHLLVMLWSTICRRLLLCAYSYAFVYPDFSRLCNQGLVCGIGLEDIGQEIGGLSPAMELFHSFLSLLIQLINYS